MNELERTRQVNSDRLCPLIWIDLGCWPQRPDDCRIINQDRDRAQYIPYFRKSVLYLLRVCGIGGNGKAASP